MEQTPSTIHGSIIRFVLNRLPRTPEIITLSDSRLGSHAGQIGDGDAKASLRNFVEFLEEAATATGDVTLGARIGQGFAPMDLGPLGLIFFGAGTLAEVFREHNRYARLTQDSTLFSIEVEGDVTYCIYNVIDRSILQRRQDSEFSLSSLCSLIRHVIGERWKPVEVHFEHAGRGNEAALSRIFHAPVSFGNSTNRLVIETADLKRANIHFNRSMAPFVRSHLTELLKADTRQETCTERVRLVLARRLGERSVTIAAIAKDLGVSARTLQRQLADEGTSFRRLIAEFRKEIATRLLNRGGVPITTVAHNLGYADGAVLARSFRAWTGTSPRQFSRRGGKE